MEIVHLENFCKNGDPRGLKDMGEDTKRFIIEVAPYIFRRFPNELNKYRQRVLKILSYILEPIPYPFGTPADPKLLHWSAHSCYMDSVFFSLFAVPNEFIDERILNANLTRAIQAKPSCSSDRDDDLEIRRRIQGELIRIARTIRNQGGSVKTCTLIRNLFRRCDKLATYGESTMQDPGEFLGILFELFDLNLATEKTIHYVGDSPRREDLIPIKTEINRTRILWSIDVFQLLDIPPRTITHLYDYITYFFSENRPQEYNGRMYNYRALSNTLIDSPYIIFNIARLEIGRLNTTIIVPQEMLILGSNEYGFSIYMHIASVVFSGRRTGGHYNAYIKYGEEWYHYDDLEPTYVRVGSYEQMIRSKPSVVTHGTQHFYTKISVL
jgi:hypothetical protein